MEKIKIHAWTPGTEGSLHGKQRTIVEFLVHAKLIWFLEKVKRISMVQLLIQVWLMWCSSSKFAWKRGKFIFELVIQAWLILCSGSKLAWKTREIKWLNSWTYMMQCERACMENNGYPWFNSWSRHEFYDSMGESL
jgi:hypothetical protein